MTAAAQPEVDHGHPGRPRDGNIEQRVIAGTVELLLATDDESKISITAITKRTGVSRAAIYRRWTSREELLVEALNSLRRDVVVPDTGHLMDDIELAYTSATKDNPPHFDRLIRTRLIAGLRNDALRTLYWDQHVSRRRDPIKAAFERGIARGQVRPDIDIEAAMDLIAGVHYYQLVARAPDGLGDQRARSALRLLWDAIKINS